MNRNEIYRRQIWATSRRPHPDPITYQAASSAATCAVALPSGGVLQFNESYTITLTEVITYQGPCDQSWLQPLGGNESSSGNSTVVKFDNPFYGSVAPQVFALATATVMSYVLVILIFITPRTFHAGGHGNGAGLLGFRSGVRGMSNSSGISVGSRPLLQKIATLTVAISLTIATADTFREVERQYNRGYVEADLLVDLVVNSTEIRVIRVISDTFLWLAQVQTLIRLFPRHKEKVTIKWLGFGLVVCDTVFSILESFLQPDTIARPRSFSDAIPALAYLFEIAMGLIYASCVIYYSLSKRRYAFWHPKMRNICLVALISLIAVLVPVVFFILDVSQPAIATWGEYVRWVGSAAASVVVWEWVERIEALEKDKRKDGILGREIYDGDEMVEKHGSDRKSGNFGSIFSFSKRSTSLNDTPRGGDSTSFDFRPRMPYRRRRADPTRKTNKRNKHIDHNELDAGARARAMQAITPISRSDTTSAGSTVYAVRYHNISSPSPAIPEEVTAANASNDGEPRSGQPTNVQQNPNGRTTPPSTPTGTSSKFSDDSLDKELELPQNHLWQAVTHPFKRKRTTPPAEVAAQIATSANRKSPSEHYQTFRARVGTLANLPKGRFTNRAKREPPRPLGVTVIPARPRTPRASLVGGDEEQPSPLAAPEVSERTGDDGVQFQAPPELPVTFIPAPKRGERTWSPADLSNPSPGPVSISAQSPVQQTGNSTASVSPTPPQPIVPRPKSTPSTSQIVRGSLTIVESQPPSRNNVSATSQRPSGGPGVT